MWDGTGADEPGRLVAGRYRLVEQIGRGGMGTVWRAGDEAVIAVLAAGGTYLAQHGRSEGSGAASQGGAKPSTSAKASLVSPTPDAATVPEGYRLVREKDFGASFPVPKGWTRKVLADENEGIAYMDPAGVVSLRVAALAFASTGPLRRSEDDEAESLKTGKLPGYSRIRMRSTTFRNMPAAIWEFTWRGRARQFHARDCKTFGSGP